MKSGFLDRFRALLSHPVFICLVSFSTCFFLALLLFLPLDPFARMIEQQAVKQGFELQINDPHLLFPLGVGAEELVVDHVQLLHPPFLLKIIDLRPLWLSLTSNNPGLVFEFKTYNGKISGSAYRDGNVFASAEKLQISESLSPQVPLVLSGELVKGEFSGKLPFAGKNRSRLQLEMGELRLAGMQSLGSSSDILPLGHLSGSIEANGPLLQISNLSVTGLAFDLKGSGSVRLGRTAARSSLNLKLELLPKGALDPALKDLLSLLKKPQSDGSYQLSLRGAMSNLRIN
jgi:type II secretion system protein N